MKNCAPEKIRNFVLAGHAGAGKTALADLMLFKGGVAGTVFVLLGLWAYARAKKTMILYV